MPKYFISGLVYVSAQLDDLDTQVAFISFLVLTLLTIFGPASQNAQAIF